MSDFDKKLVSKSLSDISIKDLYKHISNGDVNKYIYNYYTFMDSVIAKQNYSNPRIRFIKVDNNFNNDEIVLSFIVYLKNNPKNGLLSISCLINSLTNANNAEIIILSLIHI